MSKQSDHKLKKQFAAIEHHMLLLNPSTWPWYVTNECCFAVKPAPGGPSVLSSSQVSFWSGSNTFILSTHHTVQIAVQIQSEDSIFLHHDKLENIKSSDTSLKHLVAFKDCFLTLPATSLLNFSSIFLFLL
jgi:hypothetical protein